MSLLVLVDLVWFAHRMACTYSTVKLVLYGQIAYIQCRPVTTGERRRLLPFLFGLFCSVIFTSVPCNRFSWLLVCFFFQRTLKFRIRSY